MDLETSSGSCQADGPETGRDPRDGEGAAHGAGCGYDSGACLEERGDPEVPGGTSCSPEPGPGSNGASRRSRQQGAPLRPIDGVSGSVFRSTNALDLGKVLPLNKGSAQEDPEAPASEWYPQTDALFGSTLISSRHVV